MNVYVVGKDSGTAAARSIDDFAEVAGRAAGRDLSSYRDLWEWSVARPGEFRAMLFDFFEVIDRTGAECPRTALGDANMPGAQWFPGTRLNYVDHIRRFCDREGEALTGPDEVIEAPGIPHTRTGKNLRWPLRGVLVGRDDVLIDPQSVDAPDLLAWYAARGARHAR